MLFPRQMQLLYTFIFVISVAYFYRSSEMMSYSSASGQRGFTSLHGNVGWWFECHARAYLFIAANQYRKIRRA